MVNRSNICSDSDSEFFLGTIFYEDSNEELAPGLIEESDDEKESDKTDDEDTELVEPKGMKQFNDYVKECDDTGTPDGSEQNNNTDNQEDNTFTTKDTDDYDDDWYIYIETNGFFSGSGGTHGPDLPSPFGRKFLFFDVDYKIDTGVQANVLSLNEYRCLPKKPKLHKSNAKLRCK